MKVVSFLLWDSMHLASGVAVRFILSISPTSKLKYSFMSLPVGCFYSSSSIPLGVSSNYESYFGGISCQRFILKSKIDNYLPLVTTHSLPFLIYRAELLKSFPELTAQKIVVSKFP